MAEVTRVPLQPIAKGSLAKFWLGVLVGIALSAIVAFITTYEPGVSVDTLVEGEGESPGESDVVFVDYVGTLEDGTEFDRSPANQQMPPEITGMIPEGVPLELAGVVAGFREGMMETQEGGTYSISIPAEKAYGSTPPPGSPIPPDADLNFEVTVHEILTQEEFQQLVMQVQMRMLQAQQAQQPQDGSAPGETAPQPVQ